MTDREQAIRDAIIFGKRDDIQDLIKIGLDNGSDANSIINRILIPAMNIVGQRFASGDIFIPEMLVSALTMKAALEILKAKLTKKEMSLNKGKVLLATVKGDLHDIGKNLVAMMLEGSGFEVVDMGMDVSTEDIINKIKEIKPNILGLSALLTTTMPEMSDVIEELKAAKIRDKIKVIVGGAPVDDEFAKKIGADGFGEDAGKAVTLANKMMEQWD